MLARFKGSSLQMRGHFEDEKDSEWAIVGGTGEFAYARGAVTAKVIQPLTPATGRTWELRIRAFCLCISEMVRNVCPFVIVLYSINSKKTPFMLS
jgi:hypothetical protein